MKDKEKHDKLNAFDTGRIKILLLGMGTLTMVFLILYKGK
jgi:hypothetical protein